MSSSIETRPHAPEPSLFEDHATQVITRLRRAVAGVVDSIPDKPQRAVDLSASLGIDMKLAWRIAHLISEADTFSAARYIPGTAGARIFLQAARRREVSKGVLATAEAAFGVFSELVHTHAGSRKAFDMMMAAHARSDRGRADVEHRRQMFEGSSYVLGVQARTSFRVDLVAPSANGRMTDWATIRGFVDLRRLRPHVPWRISRGYSVDDAGDAHVEFAREPLVTPDDGAGSDDPPLMTEFCSKPLPECRRVEVPHGVIEFELIEGAVGNAGILTCVTGEVLRNCEPRYRTSEYREIAQMFRMRTPSEVAVFDLVIHRELFGRQIKPDLLLYSDLFSDPVAPRYRACDRLPIQESVSYLGPGPESMDTEEIPRYVDMLRLAFKRCGWDETQFDGYRTLMKYPPIPATLTLRHELPEHPAE